MSKTTTMQLVIGASYINKDDGSQFDLDAADLTAGEVRLVRHYGLTTSFTLRLTIAEMCEQFLPMSQPDEVLMKYPLLRDDLGELVNPGDAIRWIDLCNNGFQCADVIQVGNSLFASWQTTTGEQRINLRSLRRHVGVWYKTSHG
jgi:hypothetical protein